MEKEIYQNLEPFFEKAGDKTKIACEDALSVAKKLGVSSIEVAKVINKYKVKIINCQLGCF
ncbi:MAG: hypothetical protein C0594_09725 [Marinilabiliales bacterium]|nr:MAG: hypothetical protein C0594_09725 [Marinilabiliales bacterium]